MSAIQRMKDWTLGQDGLASNQEAALMRKDIAALETLMASAVAVLHDLEEYAELRDVDIAVLRNAIREVRGPQERTVTVTISTTLSGSEAAEKIGRALTDAGIDDVVVE